MWIRVLWQKFIFFLTHDQTLNLVLRERRKGECEKEGFVEQIPVLILIEITILLVLNLEIFFGYFSYACQISRRWNGQENYCDVRDKKTKLLNFFLFLSSLAKFSNSLTFPNLSILSRTWTSNSEQFKATIYGSFIFNETPICVHRPLPLHFL